MTSAVADVADGSERVRPAGRRAPAAGATGRVRRLPGAAGELVAGAREAVLIVDRDDIVVYANPATRRLLGRPLREVVGRPAASLMALANARSCSVLQFSLHDAEGGARGRMVLLRSRLATEATGAAVDADGLAGRLLRDLTRLDLRERAFTDLMQDILGIVCRETGWPVGHVFVPSTEDAGQLVCAGIWHLSDGHFEDFQRISRGMRFRAGEGLPGRAVEQQRPVWMTDVNLDAAFIRAASTAALGIRSGIAAPIYVRRQLVAVLEFFDTRCLQPNRELIAAIEDVTRQIGLLLEHRRQRTELDEFAYTDALTGTGNRRRFDQAMETAYGLAHRGVACAVCLFDMDRFKSINDRFGHAEGDRVLAEAARLARQRLRARDVLARIGGEEFAVVMFDVTLANAHQVAEALRTAIATGIALPDAGQAVTASFGVAGIDAARDADPLAALRRADAALYAAKHDGRNRVTVAD